MNKILICEGRCNGHIVKDADRFIAEAGPLPTEGFISIPPESILSTLHDFVHTVHIPISAGIYACTECGEQRRF